MSNLPKILVLDDEDMIRMNIIAFLEDEGYNAVGSASAEEALKVLEIDQTIRVAVVDIRLPGMDGNQFVLECHKKGYKIKCIIHTGSSEYNLPQELLDIGMKDEQVIFKPLVDMQLLLDLINTLNSEA